MCAPALPGTSVSLHFIGTADTTNIVKWRNSPHVKSMLFTQEDLTVPQHEVWLRTHVCSGKCAQFIIVCNNDGIAIGTSFLKGIDAEQKEAEFGIFIGEPAYLGKGLGREATLLTVVYGFKHLFLEEIYLKVLGCNVGAIKSYEQVGFTCTERETQSYCRNGSYYDVMFMSIQKDRAQGLCL